MANATKGQLSLFDNTPLQHDGLTFHVEHETASPDAGSSSSTSIPPTSHGQAHESGEAPRQDRKALAAGQNGESGAKVAQTTVPSTANPLAAGAVLICPCGCKSELGRFGFGGKRHLVCREFWFSLPHEVRRRVTGGQENERVAACRLVLKMAIARRRSMESPATEEPAQRHVAARGEPGGSDANPVPICQPKTPATDEGSIPSPASVAPALATRPSRPAGAGVIFHCRVADPSLPHEPRSKMGAPETSQEAGRSFGGDRARTLRAQVLVLLNSGAGLTADECATALKESVLAVRPRLSELHKAGLIVDSGLRRSNLSGHSAVVWSLAGGVGGAL